MLLPGPLTLHRVARRIAAVGAPRAARCLLLALAVVLLPAGVRAQEVERPEPFDSTGRVVAITPMAAARLMLGPPAWRITGDYREARLYSSAEGYVIVVTRRDGTVERYPIADQDREFLRVRTSGLPPDLEGQIAREVTEATRAVTSGEARGAFIRDQTILGFTVYAPSFAYAVTNEAAGRVATYLVVAGGSFFGASSLSREFSISPAQNRLATLGALHGGGAGFGLTYALGTSNDGQAAGIFIGSLAGTAAGLYFGRDFTGPQVAAAAFGADALGLMTAGLVGASGGFDARDDASRLGAAMVVGAAALGAPLGAMYPGLVSYNVTGGDVATLWFTGALGALGATAFVADNDPSSRAILVALTSGFAVGTVAGDRFLVKRFDHSSGDASLVGLGTAAGALMGAGVSVLLDTDRSNESLIIGLATLGGIAGIAATEYYIAPRDDAGRLAMNVKLLPAGLALAAARQRGTHPILSITF
jgi:hypothetical protein